MDSVDLHQIIISNSHISVNRSGGIKVTKSEIRNPHITGNDIEYNNIVYGSADRSKTSKEGPFSADIWIDCSKGGQVREGSIVSNTIQAVPSLSGATIRFTGTAGDNEIVGLFSITGNHIGTQMVNIHLDHTHGFSITGNNIRGGKNSHMLIENSRNVIVNANVFDHNKRYERERYQPGGIMISKCDNLILGDNIIDGVGLEHEGKGGVITVNESKEISLRGNHISYPKYRGIQINSSVNVRVMDCRVYDDKSSPSMLSAIELNGTCSGIIIRNNSIGQGKDGDIVNRATGVIIKGNITDGSLP